MEMITRGSCPTYRDGLDRCVRADLSLSPAARQAFIDRKKAGKDLCGTDEGYGVFDQRPLPKVLEEYAANDVAFLPQLFDVYWHDMGLCNNPEDMFFYTAFLLCMIFIRTVAKVSKSSIFSNMVK